MKRFLLLAVMLITVTLSALADVGIYQVRSAWPLTEGIPADIFEVTSDVDRIAVDEMISKRTKLYRQCYVYRTQDGLRWGYPGQDDSVEFLNDKTPDARDFLQFVEEKQNETYFNWLINPEYYFGRTDDVLFDGFKQFDPSKDGLPSDIYNPSDWDEIERVDRATLNLATKYHDVVSLYLQNGDIDAFYYERGRIWEGEESLGSVENPYNPDLSWFVQYQQEHPYARFFYYADPNTADDPDTPIPSESTFDFQEFDPSVHIPNKSECFRIKTQGAEVDVHTYVMDYIANHKEAVMLYFGEYSYYLVGANRVNYNGQEEVDVWSLDEERALRELVEMKNSNPNLKFYYLADYSGPGLAPDDPGKEVRYDNDGFVAANGGYYDALKLFYNYYEGYEVDPEYAGREFDVINVEDGTVVTKARLVNNISNEVNPYLVLDDAIFKNGSYSISLPFKSCKLRKGNVVIYNKRNTLNFTIKNTGFPGGYLNYPIEASDIKEYWMVEGTSSVTVNSADHLRGGSPYISGFVEVFYPDGASHLGSISTRNSDWHSPSGYYDGYYSGHINFNKNKVGEGSNIHGKVKVVLNEGAWIYNDSSEPTRPEDGVFNFRSPRLELNYFYTSYDQEATPEQKAAYERLAQVYTDYNDRYQAYTGDNLAVHGMYKGLKDEIAVATNYLEKRDKSYASDTQKMKVYDLGEIEGIITRIQDADRCLIDVIGGNGDQYNELAAAILDGFKKIGDVRYYLYKFSDYYKNDQQLPYFLDNIAQSREYVRHHTLDPYVDDKLIRVYTLQALQALKTQVEGWVTDLNAIGSGEGIKQQCGDDLWWTYADGTLTITGTGDMWDYVTSTLPWREYRSNIIKVELPEGLTSISASAFARTQITEIAIPDGVRFIESSTFDACRALTTVQLPAELINIGNSAFMSCSNLVEVKGLSSASNLRVVEEAAFYGCSSLKEAVFPTSLERLGDMVFSNCTSLERVGINGSVTQLGSDVFANCSSLKDVELNAPISIIGSHCFSRCSSLEVIDLPATLTSIGYLGFYACSSLKKVICRATTPPGLGENAFWQAGTDEITYQSARRKGDSPSGTGGASGPDGMDAIQGPGENVVLYVPAESIALYQTAEGWKEFKAIDDIANVPGGIFGIKAVGQTARKFFTPKDGIIIFSGAQRYNTQGVKLKK